MGFNKIHFVYFVKKFDHGVWVDIIQTVRSVAVQGGQVSIP